MQQLAELARPFEGKYVKRAPKGNADYVEHSDVTQRLLQVAGPFTMHVDQIIRGHVPAREGKTPVDALEYDAIVGVLLSLTVTIDGREVTVTEVGDVSDPHNWTHDGQRLKDAMSDAIKRCAMRLGLGLHLWCGDHYFLDRALARDDTPAPQTVTVTNPPSATVTVSTDVTADPKSIRKVIVAAGLGKEAVAAVGEMVAGFGGKTLEDLAPDELAAVAEHVQTLAGAA